MHVLAGFIYTLFFFFPIFFLSIFLFTSIYRCTRVNEGYMNELRLHLNESDSEDRKA